MPQQNTTGVLTTEAYSASINELFVSSKAIFDTYMTAYPIPKGSQSITWNLGGESEDAEAITEYFADTKYQHFKFSKRTFERGIYSPKAGIIERHELMNINFDPSNHKIQAMARSLNRKRNQIFLENFEANVAVTDVLNPDGTKGVTVAAFDTDNIIAPTYGSASTNSGLSLAKLDHLIELAEEQNLIGEDVAEELGYSLMMTMTESAATSLLDTPRGTSKDYEKFFVRDNTGKLVSYRGIKFIYLATKLPTYVATDTIVKHYAWHPSAFIYDPASTMNKYTAELPDKNYHGQIYSEMYYNVLRVREEAAFRIDVKK